MQRISEINQTNTGLNRPASAAPKLDMGGFSGLLEKIRKDSQAAAMEKLQDTLEYANGDDHLKIVYDHLSESAKRTLERVREDRKDIRKEEWLDLCRELKDNGAMTQSDFDCTRADVHLIPLGYTDKSGNFVKYTTSPMMQEKLRALSAQASNASLSGQELRAASDRWSGDPLAYLNDWSAMLCEWRSDMAGAKPAGGTGRFEDFSPINDQINSCQKVVELITALSRF